MIQDSGAKILDNFLKLRMTINIMTRMRMLNSDLSLEYNYKGEISKINHDKFQPKPWFDFKRLDSSKKIISGHCPQLISVAINMEYLLIVDVCGVMHSRRFVSRLRNYFRYLHTRMI